MTDPATVEKVAQAIAGDDWAAAFDSHQMQRICEGADGKYRDVNQPSKDEYRDMARDALAAHEAAIKDAGMTLVPREPGPCMLDSDPHIFAFIRELHVVPMREGVEGPQGWADFSDEQRQRLQNAYRAMIAASEPADLASARGKEG